MLPPPLAFVIAFAVVSYVTALIGELVLKALSVDHAETLAVAVAIPRELIKEVLRARDWVLRMSAELARRPFGVHDIGSGWQRPQLRSCPCSSTMWLAGVVHVREVVAARHTRPAAGIRGAAQQTLVVRETKDLGALLRELGEAAAGHRRRTSTAARPGV